MMHYNDILQKPFKNAGLKVVYQPSCLLNPYDGNSWPIQYPEVKWTDNTVVIMHCQDFVNVRNNKCLELLDIENHFGERASQVVVVVWNLNIPYNGPLNVVYFPTHSYEILVELNRRKHEWLPKFECEKTVNWQCLNGQVKPHRINVVNHLKDCSNGILSLKNQIPLPNAEYDRVYDWNNVLNWFELLPVYTKCKVNVVTETEYAFEFSIVTEKTLMAFLALQVPVVIGYKRIVDECESLGFDMFRDVVETDYDTYNDQDRWEQALVLNKDVIDGNFDYDALEERLLRNREYALTEWPELLVDWFNSSAQGILENLPQSS
jgi:hypothetical protein